MCGRTELGSEYFGDKVYVGSDDYHIYCLDSTTGKELWKSKFGNVVFSGPAVANGKVYAGCHDLYLHCLNADTGETIWQAQKLGILEFTPPPLLMIVSTLDRLTIIFTA